MYSKSIDKYYVGHTEDINARLQQHNSGTSKYTAKTTDWIVVFTQTFDTRAEARNREMNIKKMKSRKYIESPIAANQ